MKKLNIFFLIVFSATHLFLRGQTDDPIMVALKQAESLNDIYALQTKFPNHIVSGKLIPKSEARRTKLKKALKLEVGSIIKIPRYGQPCSYLKIIDKGKKYLMKVSYIFLSKNNGTNEELNNKADLILEKIKEGEKFEDLAVKFSQDSNSKKGGDLGWFTENLMTEEFERSIKSHKKGDIYKLHIPIYGYYVVKITDDHGLKDFIETITVESEKCS